MIMKDRTQNSRRREHGSVAPDSLRLVAVRIEAGPSMNGFSMEKGLVLCLRKIFPYRWLRAHAVPGNPPDQLHGRLGNLGPFYAVARSD